MWRSIGGRSVRTGRRLAQLRKPVSLFRPVTRGYSQNYNYYQAYNNNNNKIGAVLGLAAAVGAFYYVQPKKTKKAVKEEDKEQDMPAGPGSETQTMVEQELLPQSKEEEEGDGKNTEVEESDTSQGLEEPDQKPLEAAHDLQAQEEETLGPTEEQANNEGAFNPDTGEINWDCPCLGGMADGPCGEEFKVAFACFVYSEADPKGIDCVDKFQHMQDCFRKHPDYYAEQLKDEEDAAAMGEAQLESSDKNNGEQAKGTTTSQVEGVSSTQKPDAEVVPTSESNPASKAT